VTIEHNTLAWSDEPKHVIVKLGGVEHGMDVADAIELHRQIFNATVQATTNAEGRWAWENPDPQKDPP